MSKKNSTQNKYNMEDSNTKSTSDQAPVHIPFLPVIFDPYSLVMDNFRRFILLALFLGLIMAVISLSAGQGYMCVYEDYRLTGFCTTGKAVYVILRLINLLLISIFMVKWYGVCFLGQPLNWDYLLRLEKPLFKTFLALLVFIVLNLAAVLSLYLLIMRVPNPNWRIEVIYFGVVSLGFFVPFVLVRFYSVLGFVMSGEKIPSLLKIWRRGSGNTLRLIISASLLFFIAVFASFAFMNNFSLAEVKNTFYISFTTEYLYDLLLLLIAAVFTNFCRLQQNYMFGRKINEQ